MLTNFETMAKRVAKMKEYQRMRDSGEFDEMPKKEALMLSRELTKIREKPQWNQHAEGAAASSVRTRHQKRTHCRNRS